MLRKLMPPVPGVLSINLHAQSAFTIKGYGKGYKEGDSIFLEYRQGKERVSAVARGYLCRNDNPRFAMVLQDAMDVYIEPRKICLQSADTLNNPVTGGTRTGYRYATAKIVSLRA